MPNNPISDFKHEVTLVIDDMFVLGIPLPKYGPVGGQIAEYDLDRCVIAGYYVAQDCALSQEHEVIPEDLVLEFLTMYLIRVAASKRVIVYPAGVGDQWVAEMDRKIVATSPYAHFAALHGIDYQQRQERKKESNG